MALSSRTKVTAAILVIAAVLLFLFFRSRPGKKPRPKAPEVAAKTEVAPGTIHVTAEQAMADLARQEELAATAGADLTLQINRFTPSNILFRATLDHRKTTDGEVRYEFTLSDGTHVVNTTGELEHSFAYPQDEQVPTAHYTVKVTGSDADESSSAEEVIEFDNLIGVLAAKGTLMVETRDCTLVFSDTFKAWNCGTYIRNPHDEEITLVSANATRVRGALPSEVKEEDVAKKPRPSDPQKSGDFIQIPLSSRFPRKVPAGQRFEVDLQIPIDFLSDDTVAITASVSGRGIKSGKLVTLPIVVHIPPDRPHVSLVKPGEVGPGQAPGPRPDGTPYPAVDPYDPPPAPIVGGPPNPPAPNQQSEQK